MIAVSTGVGFSGTIVNDFVSDAPPPGAGLDTLTLAVPDEIRSPDSIVALKVVLLTNVVARVEPFHNTVELLMKPEPLAVKMKPGSPATAEL
jgi:hypothetical protein